MHPRRPTEIFGLLAATTVPPGVGPKLAAAIEKRIGAHVIDLLRHLPIGLIDRRARPPLGEVADGSIATFEVLVVKHDKPPPGTRRRGARKPQRLRRGDRRRVVAGAVQRAQGDDERSAG